MTNENLEHEHPKSKIKKKLERIEINACNRVLVCMCVDTFESDRTGESWTRWVALMVSSMSFLGNSNFHFRHFVAVSFFLFFLVLRAYIYEYMWLLTVKVRRLPVLIPLFYGLERLMPSVAKHFLISFFFSFLLFVNTAKAKAIKFFSSFFRLYACACSR